MHRKEKLNSFLKFLFIYLFKRFIKPLSFLNPIPTKNSKKRLFNYERHLQLKQAAHHSSEKVTRFYFWHTVFNRERALSLVNILLALVSLWGREHWDV
jgi:hypothetical protein